MIAFDEPRVADLLDKDYVSLFSSVLEEGRKRKEKYSEKIKEYSNRKRTLIYTSGTTGKPKGAMLTHRNIVSNIKSAHDAIHIDHQDRCLSFLPLSHSFERTGGYYAMMAAGAEIC